jgi:hypothetical protein
MGVVHRLWEGNAGQDVAEYAIMLAVILAIAMGTIRLYRRQRRYRIFLCGERGSITL